MVNKRLRGTGCRIGSFHTMGRVDVSKAAELRLLAEKLRRHAREMTIGSYIEMMECAARELEAEARELELDHQPKPGQRLNLIV